MAFPLVYSLFRGVDYDKPSLNPFCFSEKIFCFLLHYKSVMSRFLSTWVGLLSNRVDLLSNRVGLLLNGVCQFSGEVVLENAPTPSLSSTSVHRPWAYFRETAVHASNGSLLNEVGSTSALQTAVMSSVLGHRAMMVLCCRQYCGCYAAKHTH